MAKKRLTLMERWAIDSEAPMGGMVFEGESGYKERAKPIVIDDLEDDFNDLDDEETEEEQ